MDDAMSERAKVVAWLRSESRRVSGPQFFLRGMGLAMAASSIERGHHDAIAIPRLSGDQGAK